MLRALEKFTVEIGKRLVLSPRETGATAAVDETGWADWL